LNSWIKQIIMVAMFTLLVDMIMPDNGLKKYIKVILGTVVMIAILNPVILLLKANFPISIGHGMEQLEAMGYFDENLIYGQAEKIKSENIKMALGLYEKELEERILRQLKQLTFLEISNADVQLEQDGSIRKVRIALKSPMEDAEINKLTQYLSAFYEIPEAKILVEVEGN